MVRAEAGALAVLWRPLSIISMLWLLVLGWGLGSMAQHTQEAWGHDIFSPQGEEIQTSRLCPTEHLPSSGIERIASPHKGQKGGATSLYRDSTHDICWFLSRADVPSGVAHLAGEWEVGTAQDTITRLLHTYVPISQDDSYAPITDDIRADGNGTRRQRGDGNGTRREQGGGRGAEGQGTDQRLRLAE